MFILFLCYGGYVMSSLSGKGVSGKRKSPTKTANANRSGIVSGGSVLRLDESGKFMNARQLRYFKEKLLLWRSEISAELAQTLEDLQEENLNAPDVVDMASSQADRSLDLRARDRQGKLLAKIDAALARIEDKTYGYCEETGEPISLQRLDARPIATLSLEAQERHERRERVYRDD